MAKSVAEIIAERQAEEVRQKAIRQETEQNRLDLERSARQNEHERKLAHSKEVADRVFKRSGVLSAIDELKQDLSNGKVGNQAPFTRLTSYYEQGSVLTLLWGDIQKLHEDGAYNLTSIHVGVKVSNESLHFSYGGSPLESRVDYGISVGKWMWMLNKQSVKNALAEIYMSLMRPSSGEFGLESYGRP